MKPLGERTKDWAQTHLVRGPLRTIAAPAFHALLGAQLRWLTRRSGGPSLIPEGRVTAVIKTFERPHRCEALVSSIRRRFPGLAIIVVDDSRRPREYSGCTMIRLPFDSGLSAGRNAGVDQVDTDYCLILDDDFLVDRKTDLGGALAILDAHPRIDLLGGSVVDLPLFIRHDFRGAGLFPTDARPIIAPGSQIGPAEVFDKVPNFFLARTEALRRVRWDPALKLVEHADFFTRARGRIVSAHWGGWRILHCRDPFDDDYLAHRNDTAAAMEYLGRKYPAHPKRSGAQRSDGE